MISRYRAKPWGWGLFSVLPLLLPLAGCAPMAESEPAGTTASSSVPTADTSLANAKLEGSAESSGEADSPAGERQADASSPDALDVSLQTLAVDKLSDVIARHAGSVVLIDFWATWCGPCLQQFPHTIELGHRYEDAGLRVLSVSCDEPEDRAKVLDTLRKLEANIENHQTDSDLQTTFDAFDIRGGIPFYQLYDRQGALRYRFNGAPAPGDEAESTELLDIRIRQLLDEQ